jgi:ABC-type transporter Mla maintaining outer membrane lipid asymmetry permease subunit MlaE
MIIFRRFGFRFARFAASVNLFFQYIGHMIISIPRIIYGYYPFSWNKMAKTLFVSGAKLVIPLMLISSLLGTSVSLNISSLLGKFNLQEQALNTALNILTRDFLPMILAIVLCTQSAFDLINAKIRRLTQAPHGTLVDYILPIMLGLNLSSLLLYVYSLFTTFLSIFIIHNYVFGFNLREFLLILSTSVTVNEILLSILKTSMYCFFTSIIVGYYYYQLAAGFIPLRRAVSRIVTRGLFWLAMMSVCFKTINL